MKKNIYLLLILTAIVAFGFEKPTDAVAKQINVVIDVAHGGTDSGVTIKGISEKQLVEQLSKKIKSSNQNVKIHFTRNEDTTLSLQERTEIINALKPDLVLSIHVNANKDSNKSGLEFYIAKENEFTKKSTEIAKELNTKLSENDFLKMNELKTAPFFLLKKANAPAIIIELGYLSNENDFKYLTDTKAQDKIANSISEFISELQ